MDITFISRQRDGLVFAESWNQSFARSDAALDLKRQAQEVLRAHARQAVGKASIDARDNNVFHTLVANGVVYLTVCKQKFDSRLAFLFLEEVQTAFEEEIKRKFGTMGVDYASSLETIERPYYFVEFDRIMQRKRADYADSRSNKAVKRLNESLNEVTGIMRKNIEDLLQRGENLDNVSSKAERLKADSDKFKKMTKTLAWQAYLQKIAPLVILLCIVCVLVFWRFM